LLGCSGSPLLPKFILVFSLELFFALSWQIIWCVLGDLVNQLDWAQLLCSPAVLD
jgi:hypothetical protein